MNKKKNRTLPYRPYQGVRIADAFKKVAFALIKTTERTPNVGDLFAAGTNLALALEIYLNVLLCITGKPVSSHKLLHLYNQLPCELKDSIKQNFDTAVSFPVK